MLFVEKRLLFGMFAAICLYSEEWMQCLQKYDNEKQKSFK
jgi:hypothetical protein